MEPHDVEIVTVDHARPDLARVAQTVQRKADRGELADLAERLDTLPQVLNLRDGKTALRPRPVRARSDGCKSGGFHRD